MEGPSGLQALAGQTALIEAGPLELTGTVDDVEQGTVTIVCDQACWDSGETRHVAVTVFAPDALYRLSGGATARDRVLLVEPDADMESIQRRRWPRRSLDLPVMICPVVNGSRVEGVPGRTVDVGIGGICVETLRRIEGEGDPMVILSLPDGTTVVSGSATVEAEDLGDGWRYRLAFSGIDVNDAGRIAALTTPDVG